MKKYSGITAVTVGVLGLMFFAASASAQVTNTTGTPREKMQEKREEVKTNIQEKRADVKNRLEDKRKNLIRSYSERIVKNLTQTLERLENIANRLSTRLDKLVGEGVSVTEARTKLAVAKTKIEEATTAVGTIKTFVETMLASEDPKAAFEQVKEAIEQAHEKVRAAHAALVDVINSIKPGLNIKPSTTTPASP
ncbi:MAG TPA: hypothetical protein VJH94_00205 [Candidatus Paceibacterota bacterium]